MTFRASAGVAVLSLALAAAAACGGGDGPQAPATAPPQQTEPLFKPIDPSAAPPVPPSGPATATLPPAQLAPAGGAEPMAMVTDMASGWPVTLRVGQLMSARLAADRAAGGRWSLRAGSDAGVVAVEGEPAFETVSGTPGVQVFRLKAVKPGQTALTFDLRKGTEAAAVRSVSYPVTVQ